MYRVLYSPDAGIGVTATNGSATDTHIRHVANLPAKDATLLAVSQAVNSKWAASSFITLAWKAQPDFANEVAAFKAQMESRNTAGGKRSQQTKDLENLDDAIKEAVPYVKSYIAEKFGPPNARAQYAAFGIVHRGRAYELPVDRQKRKDALRMMTDAIAANGFDAKQYGTAFWVDIKARYDDALAVNISSVSNVSGNVSQLVMLRAGLRRVLHSILLLLEANYPDTFDQVRREWGFQKEIY